MYEEGSVIGCMIVVAGFILMSGGGSENPNEFNEAELFSFRRITLAPIFIISGYAVVLYGVLKRPKLVDSDEIKSSS